MREKGRESLCFFLWVSPQGRCQGPCRPGTLQCRWDILGCVSAVSVLAPMMKDTCKLLLTFLFYLDFYSSILELFPKLLCLVGVFLDH